ncbi:MAG: aminotransferase class I/II-fold pyridoxal phosphate-dependent enzyme [Armatimonadetes bacterium]|nr:aminotransferase class I/II-fold pyridoxal phosphate-dependent enzyme [Armatimonadota bacterium]
MMAAIASAPLGDDVLGDDPTVTELEALAAEMTGMEAAVFVPSGTMGNQIGLASWTKPGDSVLIEDEAHVLYYECGAPAVLSGVVLRGVPSEGGRMSIEDLEKKRLRGDIHTPGTTLLCLENTHNRGGGSVLSVADHLAYRAFADQHGLRVHLDGARVFNASVALGVDVREITALVDSVSICLSKGLASPVGSVLCGPADFIGRARQWRKRLGGGMRQAGILAACGLVSLRTMVDRLADDHARARALASALTSMPGLSPHDPATNILMVDTVVAADQWQQALAVAGVMCFPVGANRLRLVFHKDIDDDGVRHTAEAFRQIAVTLV